MSKPASLWRFILLTIALLIPGFVLWMAINPWLSQPLVLLGDLLLQAWMPELVTGLQFQNPTALLLTPFGEVDGRIVDATQAGARLAFQVDIRVLSYSLPFYAALHFASPGKPGLEQFSLGFLILYPLVFFGFVSLCLKQLMTGLGDTFTSQEIPLLPGPDLVALLYQLNTILIPALAPILVWAWQSRNSELLNFSNH